MLVIKLNIKNNIFNIIVLLLVIFANTIDTKAQFASFSNEFLNIGVDAASMARGEAVVSSVSGVSSGYCNPAGLVNSNKKLEIALMHANYFSGLAQYDYLGASYKLTDSLALGLSAIRFGVDDIPNTLRLIDNNGNVNYDRISYFSVADYAVLLSLARKSIVKNLLWGASIKLIYRRQGGFAEAYGFGFDLGAQYKLNKWLFGLNLRDATSTFNIWIFNTETFEDIFKKTNNEIPENSLELSSPKLIAGVAREFKFTKKIALLLELDFDMYVDGEHHTLVKAKPISLDPHIGFEIRYLRNIFLRGGVNKLQIYEDFDSTNKTGFQPNVGIGVSFLNFSLDYALTDVGDMTIAPISHIFSLKYCFNSNRKKN